MKTIETLEKIAKGESFYDVMNASGMGDSATVLAAKANPRFQDIVHNHTKSEINSTSGAYGGLGLLGGGAAGAGLGALTGAVLPVKNAPKGVNEKFFKSSIRKGRAGTGAVLGALALGLTGAAVGSYHGHEKGLNKAKGDLRKAKLI